jgi:hypothetical protein
MNTYLHFKNNNLNVKILKNQLHDFTHSFSLFFKETTF